jgi:hypothetical protein
MAPRSFIWPPNTISKPIAHSAQTVHLPFTDINTTPNGPKQGSTWPMSSRSSIGCAKNDFQAYCTFDAKPYTYLVLTLTLSQNGPKRASTWPTSHRSTIGYVQNDFEPMVHLVQTVPYLMSRLTLPPNEPTSPRSSIRCAQKEFHARGTFEANCEAILRQD